MNLAYVALGSNLGDAPGYLREALARLAMVATPVANSDFYITRPWGKPNQPHFYNAVVALDMGRRRDPQRLLYALTAIETEYERTRVDRWGPRTLDLDLLAYDDIVDENPRYTVPHPLLRQRAFVLAPLADIAPDLRLPPDGATPKELLEKLTPEERENIVRLPGTGHLPAARAVDYDADQGPGAEYDQLRPLSAFDREVFDAVANAVHASRGMKILDVGCGTGRFSRLLADAGATVTGLDKSETMLARAREQSPGGNPTYVSGDAVEHVPGENWNAITAFFTVHHFSSLDRFLLLAKQKLVPEGTLAIASFPHRHFAESPFARFFPNFAAIDMARFPSAPALSRMMRQVGFANIEQRDVVGEAVHDFPSIERLVQHKYISTFHLLDNAELAEGLESMRAAWGGAAEIRRALMSVVISGRRP